MKYRISFYGYQKVGGEIYPVIKLRKILSERNMDYKDRGIELEIATIGIQKSTQFTDKEIERMIKEEYCK